MKEFHSAHQPRDTKTGLLDLIALLEQGFVVYGEHRLNKMTEIDKARIQAAQSSLESIKNLISMIDDYGV